VVSLQVARVETRADLDLDFDARSALLGT